MVKDGAAVLALLIGSAGLCIAFAVLLSGWLPRVIDWTLAWWDVFANDWDDGLNVRESDPW